MTALHWTCVSSGHWQGRDGGPHGPVLIETMRRAKGWKLRFSRGLWISGPFRTFDEMHKDALRLIAARGGK